MSRTLLFVVNVDWFFLSHRLPIALEAMRQGYQVHIATGLTDRLDELQRNGLVVHPLALDRSSAGFGNAWRTMLQLWQIFKAVRPDVVHLVTIKPVLLGGLVARLAGVPAVVAAVSGLGFVFMARGETVFTSLAIARVCTFLVGIGLMLSQKQKPPALFAHPLAMLSGVFDAAGNMFYVWAKQFTRLDVAAVLSSLYPASTIVLAWLILKDKIGRVQLIGVIMCLLAVALIATS